MRAAATTIDERLHVFPQHGDPLADLSLEPGQIRILTIPPLVVRYALYPELRLVTVITPITPLSHSGL